MQKIYNFYNCFDTIQGRLYRQNSPSGIAVTASTSTRLVPASLSGNGTVVYATFTNQNAIPFPIGTTVSVTGITVTTGYNGTFSIATASITGGVATIGWSASITGISGLTGSLVKFSPENKIVVSSVAGLTGGMTVVGTGVTATTTVTSINTTSNLLTLSYDNLDLISAGQFFYLGRNVAINTNTPLDCLNVYKRKVISSGLTGDPTQDTILQLQNSFEEALAQSPNSEEVRIVEDPTQQIKLVLITESKTQWDDNEKNIAAPLTGGFAQGLTVDWIRTGLKYLILDQNYTQKAYYSGKMRQANFLLKWFVGSTTYSQWAVIIGPTQKDSDFVKKENMMVDPATSPMQILMGRTAGTSYLSRYNRVIFGGQAWRMININDYDSDYIVKIALEENFIDPSIDDVVNLVANNEEPNVGIFQSLVLGDLT